MLLVGGSLCHIVLVLLRSRRTTADSRYEEGETKRKDEKHEYKCGSDAYHWL